jgi:hypothetical protein
MKTEKIPAGETRFINLMGLNTKISINVVEEEDDELLWKAQKEVANPNEN